MSRAGQFVRWTRGEEWGEWDEWGSQRAGVSRECAPRALAPSRVCCLATGAMALPSRERARVASPKRTVQFCAAAAAAAAAQLVRRRAEGGARGQAPRGTTKLSRPPSCWPETRARRTTLATAQVKMMQWRVSLARPVPFSRPPSLRRVGFSPSSYLLFSRPLCSLGSLSPLVVHTLLSHTHTHTCSGSTDASPHYYICIISHRKANIYRSPPSTDRNRYLPSRW